MDGKLEAEPHKPSPAGNRCKTPGQGSGLSLLCSSHALVLVTFTGKGFLPAS